MRRRVKGASQTLAVQVADAVSRMRDSDVQKPPGIAEAIDWLAALSLLGVERLDAGGDRPHARLGAQVRRGPGGDPRGRPRAARAQPWLTRPPSGWRRSSSTCPPLAGAFGQRLHAAGVPMTPGAAGRPRTGAGARAPDQPPAAVLDGTRRARQRSHAGRRLRPRLPRRLRRSPVRRELRPRRGPHRRRRRAARRPAAGRASDGERRDGRDPRARSLERARATTTAPRSRCRWRWPATRSAWPARASTRSSPSSSPSSTA